MTDRFPRPYCLTLLSKPITFLTTIIGRYSTPVAWSILFTCFCKHQNCPTIQFTANNMVCTFCLDSSIPIFLQKLFSLEKYTSSTLWTNLPWQYTSFSVGSLFLWYFLKTRVFLSPDSSLTLQFFFSSLSLSFSRFVLIDFPKSWACIRISLPNSLQWEHSKHLNY